MTSLTFMRLLAALAMTNVLAGMLIDEQKPRGICYHIVLGTVGCGAILSAFLLQESRDAAVRRRSTARPNTGTNPIVDERAIQIDPMNLESMPNRSAAVELEVVSSRLNMHSVWQQFDGAHALTLLCHVAVCREKDTLATSSSCMPRGQSNLNPCILPFSRSCTLLSSRSN
eukprot:SAG31_NODE_2857_length_4991_cov_51.196443_4_plen_171_part_00